MFRIVSIVIILFLSFFGVINAQQLSAYELNPQKLVTQVAVDSSTRMLLSKGTQLDEQQRKDGGPRRRKLRKLASGLSSLDAKLGELVKRQADDRDALIALYEEIDLLQKRVEKLEEKILNE